MEEATCFARKISGSSPLSFAQNNGDLLLGEESS
jgi:hypothetical protein